MEEKLCSCGSKEIRYPLFDGYGIFMQYVCGKCEEDAVSRYRSDIFDLYDCDETIEDNY